MHCDYVMMRIRGALLSALLDENLLVAAMCGKTDPLSVLCVDWW